MLHVHVCAELSELHACCGGMCGISCNLFLRVCVWASACWRAACGRVRVGVIVTVRACLSVYCLSGLPAEQLFHCLACCDGSHGGAEQRAARLRSARPRGHGAARRELPAAGADAHTRKCTHTRARAFTRARTLTHSAAARAYALRSRNVRAE
eukprot:777404-Pleurochrysis_carterae.AAC.1